MADKPPQDYQELSLALDTVLTKIQEPDIQVDEAVKLYKEGLDLVAKLEHHLAQAENTIKSLKLHVGDEE